jgi:hypothetical protein
MKVFLLVVIFFGCSSVYADRSFSNISVSLSSIDTKLNDGIGVDGQGTSIGINFEIGNQFYLTAAKNKADYDGSDNLYNYEVRSDVTFIGIGRYFKLSESSKLSFGILTARPKQSGTRISKSNGSTGTYSEQLTTGQRIGVSYIYEPTQNTSLSVGFVREDFGIYEEKGFSLDAVVSITSIFDVGIFITKIDKTEQIGVSLNYTWAKSKE